MRTPRIKTSEPAVYHCLSRINGSLHLLGPVEQERFVGLMRAVAGFCGVDVLSYCVMSNHFHVLARVPEPQPLDDSELVRRVGLLYPQKETDKLARSLERLSQAETSARTAGQLAKALDAQLERDATRGPYLGRMYDVSKFVGLLKQRFTTWFNTTHDRKGTLWDGRFKSVLAEEGAAVLTMAAYIDLNPLRAKLCQDPKDYRFSSYGAAVGGVLSARAGLSKALELAGGGQPDWTSTQAAYRKLLFGTGEQNRVKSGRLAGSIDPEQVKAVFARGGELTLSEMLHCRVRYFADGAILGTSEYIQRIFQENRAWLGPHRQVAPQPMLGGNAIWGPLRVFRHLRLAPIS